MKEEEVKSSWFYPEPMHSTAANLAHNDEDLTAPRLGPAAAVAAQSRGREDGSEDETQSYEYSKFAISVSPDSNGTFNYT